MKCGLCDVEVPGKVRELNQHKAEAHPAERQATRARRKARVARRGVSMNRCDSCNSFVSLEPSEPQEDNADVEPGGTVSGSVRLSLQCGSCSGEMAEASSDFESEVELAHAEDCEGPELELEEIEIGEMDEEGGGRFSKHLYFTEVSGKVSCRCGAEEAFTCTTGKVSASAFDSTQ